MFYQVWKHTSFNVEGKRKLLLLVSGKTVIIVVWHTVNSLLCISSKSLHFKAFLTSTNLSSSPSNYLFSQSYNYLSVCQECLLGFLTHKLNCPINNLGAIRASREMIRLMRGWDGYGEMRRLGVVANSSIKRHWGNRQLNLGKLNCYTTDMMTCLKSI